MNTHSGAVVLGSSLESFNHLILKSFDAVVSGQCSNETEWECLDQSRCIDVRRRCDGYQDCRDLSDENDQMCRDSKWERNVEILVPIHWSLLVRSIDGRSFRM